ncbi:MAG: CPBP family intramembrane glutamic endopeptidase [Planctomycetaceae bacterium]
MNDQATPLQAFFLSSLASFGLLVLFFFFYGWTQLFRGLSQGRPPIAFTPRKQVPWSILELLCGIFIYLLVSLLFVSVINHAKITGDDSAPPVPSLVENRATVGAMIASSLLSACLIGAFLALISGATLTDLGFDSQAMREFSSDARLGFVCFSMLAPIVFGIQFFLVQIAGFKSEHPLMKVLESNKDPLLFILVAILATIVAPIVEEFFFRVVVQGSLQHLLWYTAQPEAGTATPTSHQYAPQNQESPFLAASTYPANFLQSAFPILLSSTFFAILHYSHGPDWVPLMVLAFGLGYIYQQTHRIVPVIVVHFLLNSFSMTAFAIQLFIVGTDKLPPN